MIKPVSKFISSRKSKHRVDSEIQSGGIFDEIGKREREGVGRK